MQCLYLGRAQSMLGPSFTEQAATNLSLTAIRYSPHLFPACLLYNEGYENMEQSGVENILPTPAWPLHNTVWDNLDQSGVENITPTQDWQQHNSVWDNIDQSGVKNCLPSEA